MKIEINLAENGVIVHTIHEDVPDQVEVFETEDGMGNELYDGRAAVLWTLIDRLGWYGSKHDEKRIRIVIEEREAEDAKS